MRKCVLVSLVIVMVPLSIVLFGLLFMLGRPDNLESHSIPTPNTVTPNTINLNPLTSHVLDISIGHPASGLRVVLYRRAANGSWIHVIEQFTNSDGRVGNLISGQEFTPDVYKLYFDTSSYFKSRGEKTFYPYIEVTFEIENPNEHYHVPVLLSAYGYSTYRGS